MGIAGWLVGLGVFIFYGGVAVIFILGHHGYRWGGRIRYPPNRKVHTCSLPGTYSDPIYHAPDGTTFTCRRCGSVWTLRDREWLDRAAWIARLESDLEENSDET